MLALALIAAWADAAGMPATPCAGIEVADPVALERLLAESEPLGGDTRLVVSWKVELDGTADASLPARLGARGVQPWLALTFRTPAPLTVGGEALEREVSTAATIAGSAPPDTRFIVVWSNLAQADPDSRWEQYAFLLKRAAAAIAGARGEPAVVTTALPPDESVLRRLYAAGIAAYIEALSLAPVAQASLPETLRVLAALDPGRPVILSGVSMLAPGGAALAAAADLASRGVAAVLFSAEKLEATMLAPLLVMAREFAGDLAAGAPVRVSDGARAWAFVRGNDLGQRLVVEAPNTAGPVTVTIADGALRRPQAIAVAPGAAPQISGFRVGRDAVDVTLTGAQPLTILRLDRLSAKELHGEAESQIVIGERSLPVEEILRRLQAREDAQARRLAAYIANLTEKLRYRPGTEVETTEVTTSGAYFFKRGEAPDWVWERILLDGVRWRGQHPLELQRVQPQRAASLPLEISLTPAYRYRLLGVAEVSGRSCWVVGFEPSDPSHAAGLYRGRVWIDRELFARVRSEAVQTGLTGVVISNQETVDFLPVDATGQVAAWQRDSFVLPIRSTGQRLERIVGSTVQVERSVTMADISINPSDFEARRHAAYRSEARMVRETPDGLRFLGKVAGSDARSVEAPDLDTFFLVAGTFYDKSLDYPLPIVGVAYFTESLFGTGAQAQVLATPLISGSIAQPSVFGSRWTAGASLTGLLFMGDETQYRDGEEVKAETVKHGTAGLGLFLGRTLGNFAEIKLTYAVTYDRFGRAKDTADSFVVPQTTSTQTGGVEFAVRRWGWSFVADGEASRRDEWSFWGMSGNPEYDAAQKDYARYRASIGKTFWSRESSKLSFQIDYLGGSDLDRFSKYGFGPLADSRVNGYQSGLITASNAGGVHVNYAFTAKDVIQLHVNGDAVWVTDKASGLDNRLLSGVGVGGLLMGPWETIVNFDLGVPVAGPANGITALILVLRKIS